MISDLEASILGLIIEGYSYGYELEKAIDERNMRNWTEIAFSSIYYVLKRLEKQGLIASTSKNVNGRSRQVYSVTPEGTQAMNTKVNNLLSEYHSLTDPFDLGLSNLNKITPKEALAALQSYRKSLETHDEYLKQSLAKVKEMRWPFYIHGQLKRSMKKLAAEKEWVEEFTEEMRELYSKKGEI